jgi:hypothetical protein
MPSQQPPPHQPEPAPGTRAEVLDEFEAWIEQRGGSPLRRAALRALLRGVRAAARSVRPGTGQPRSR